MGVKSLPPLSICAETCDYLINYDEILKHLGEFGKFQIRVHILLWLVSVFSGVAVVTWVFTGFDMKYRCPIPQCDDPENGISYYYNSTSKLSLPKYAQKGIPSTTLEQKSLCNYYKVYLNEKEPGSCDEYITFLEDNRAVKTETPCHHSELIFDTSIVTSSIVKDYNLTCENFGLHSLIGSTYLIGQMIGSILIGILSDKFGRIPALMISLLLCLVPALLSAVIPTLGGYGLFRFVTGMGGMGCFIVPFVLAVEYVGSKYTMLVGMLIEIPYALGGILLGLEAFYIRDWYTLHLVAFMPWTVLLGLWFIIPESPRWLIAMEKYEKAIVVIKEIEEVNHVTVPSQLLDLTFQSKIKEEYNEFISYSSIELSNEDNVTFRNLFVPNKMALRTINMYYQWFVVVLCYFGLTFSSTSLGGDPYTNFLIGIASEIPASIFCILVLDRWGRRPITFFCQTAGGVSFIIVGILFKQVELNQNLIPLQVFFSVLAKFMVSASYFIIFVYTAELYPTVIRNSAIGSCCFVGNVGGVFAFVLQPLAEYYLPAPMLIMGVAALVSGLLVYFLPETVGNRLPETMEEALNIGCKKEFKEIFMEETCLLPKESNTPAR